jgi:hypothetical protein
MLWLRGGVLRGAVAVLADVAIMEMCKNKPIKFNEYGVFCWNIPLTRERIRMANAVLQL